MIIVAGAYEMAPELREEFLRARDGAMRQSRREKGCHDYVLSADPIAPGRVVLYERWADEASLSAHIAAQRTAAESDAPPVPATLVEIIKYEISASGDLLF